MTLSIACRRIAALMLFATSVTPAALARPAAERPAPDVPRLERRGAVSQLIVKGQPFLVLGGEVHNSTSSSLAYMAPIWPRLAAMNLNTVLVPVSWEQIEPREGVYDFTLVDGLIRDARRHNLRLSLLWFGTWKNMVSSYAPAWVRSDRTRFPAAIDRMGNALPIMSTFNAQGQAADARAFAALMRHLRQIDGVEQTVLMVQVENEVGLGGGERDHSEAADRAYAGAVPSELISRLKTDRNGLSRELLSVWTAAGARTSGSWEEVFGTGPETSEIFMAWHYARYMSNVVEDGHRAYPLPLFTNAAIGRRDGKTGTYPSGGPLPLVLDIWQVGAPQIGMLSPDIYYGDFGGWATRYTQSGNPLFVPEMRGGAEGAANAFLAIGNHGAIGVSPFGIDGEAGGPEMTGAYAILRQLGPAILAHQPRGTVRAAKVDATSGNASIAIGDYILTVALRRDRGNGKAAEQGYALVIADAADRFTIAGRDVQITFASKLPRRTVGLDVVEEGRFDGDRWVPLRRLNGDETMLDYGLSTLAATYQYGTGLRFGGAAPQILRVGVFPIQ